MGQASAEIDKLKAKAEEIIDEDIKPEHRSRP
jgi:hypothetical protein